jgi:hypothetical protein
VPDKFIIPTAIEAVIQDFELRKVLFTISDISSELDKERRTLKNPSDAENFAAWAEILAFALVDTSMHSSPSGTFFGPMGSGTDKDGKTFYFPDIAGADSRVIAHWIGRAKALNHPVLKARYADLAWEMCTVIARTRRDPEMARLAIDTYLASEPDTVLTERHDRFGAALRALDLASLIHDPERTERARATLLRLHREVMTTRNSQWWIAFDRLIEDKNAGVTEAERQQLIADLEDLVARFGDTSKPESFNPHAVQDAAKRLIRHYIRLHRHGDVKRLHLTIARGFEHFAGLGDAMLAAAVLQTSVDAYRDAGLKEESQRVRILMQEEIGQSRDHMAAFETEIKISRDDMEEFLKTVVVGDLWSTFIRIATEFLPNRRHLEEEVQKSLQQAPLLAHMPQAIMADDHIAAKVSSVENDSYGRLLQRTSASFALSGIWLQVALERAIETYDAMPEHFASWANRLNLFDDVTFLIEGVRAWYERDLVKAVHVLVPQIERGLRGIVAKLGKPVTKPHSRVAGVGVAIGMGDILYSDETTQALGPDLPLYFLALYADPRGRNLRNQVAHGLVKLEAIDGNLVRWLIHTLLVFGVWKELAERRR